MSQNRKRSREDSDECLPISKRINRLQIGNSTSSLEGDGNSRLVNNNLHKGAGVSGGPPWPENGHVSPTSDVAWHQGHPANGQLSPGTFPVNGHLNSHYSATAILQPTSSHPQCSNSQQSPTFVEQRNSFNQSDVEDLEDLGPYDPELSQRENPHYYTANAILYNAHAQRNQRHLHKADQL